jgi:hypothetical protein
VSLAGRLEEIELAELLHFLALNNRTGKVTLTRRDAHGLVVVRIGRIVYAASSSIRETFGNILVCRGLLTPEVLATALERQHLAADRRRLGALLVESGAISEAQLQEVLQQQTGLVVQELCRWRSGYFKFEVDEASPSPEPASTPRAIASAPFAPALRGEVTLGLLRRAAPFVGRGVLLVLRGDEAHGAGQVGLGGSDPDELARRVRLPLGEPSVVAQALERRESWKGAVPPGAANDRLLDLLGGTRPSEALVVPMLLREGAGLVLYGDDAGSARPLGATEELEWALLEAGLAMEQDLLEQRLADFERARGYRP